VPGLKLPAQHTNKSKAGNERGHLNIVFPGPRGMNQAQLKPEEPPQPPGVAGLDIPLLNPPRELELLHENIENCFWISSDPHDGHFTSLIFWEESTKSSKFFLHLLHINSYIGIICYLWSVCCS